jgi:hypothetical protein
MPNFAAGRNIAMKVPPHQYEATIRFYRDVIGLEPIEAQPPALGFKFGSNQLWIDRVTTVSQAEIWLEVVTDDVDQAAKLLESEGVVRCDEIEPLGDMKAFWISSPAAIVHLVCEDDSSW